MKGRTMAKRVVPHSTSYSAERFAHPFFVSTPPAARQPVEGHKRMVEFNKTHLGPVPPPSRNNGRMLLPEIIGAEGTKEIEDAGELRFHALGDSGVDHALEAEEIAKRMADDYKPDQGAKNPAFLFHLGDVVYGPGKDDHYGERFYRPYMKYPGKIVGIPGNHDGEVKSDADRPSLRAFRANFCADTAVIPRPALGSAIYRKTMTQPGVYWMLDAPFVRIVALYTNIAEGPGFLEGCDANGQQDRSQITWLTARLTEIAAAQKNNPKALIITTHHPPFSQGSHSGSGEMLQTIDTACTAAGVWPHAILSGHAHNYQRYTRSIQVDGRRAEVPCVVAGTGGIGVQRVIPARGQRIDDAIYERATSAHGFLAVAVTAKRLTIAFWDADGKAKKPVDSVTVNVKSRTIA
jgi:hypothetical protein